MPHAGFVHLRLQSVYSMLEGAIQPEDLAKTCRISISRLLPG
jgi:DNA polymerase III alpha subunit